MDSQIGLDYIVENRDYTSKLALALDTVNVTVKKQVFELLSALCVYSPEGYARALDALEYYKNSKGERYRFKVIVNELRDASTLEYQIALLAFVNCLIISVPQLKDRMRVRNEFIGLKLHELLNQLQRTATDCVPGDKQGQELRVQLDVYNEQRDGDEAAARTDGPHNFGVDLNSHLDIFYAILRQVVDTPQEIPFLNILQHLLGVDPREDASDVVWDVAETLVHRATLLESREEASRLLGAHGRSLPKLASGERSCYCSCHRDSTDNGSKRKQSSSTITDGARPLVLPPIVSPTTSTGPPAPPPPPMPSGGPAPPPPPPLPPLMKPSVPPPPPPLLSPTSAAQRKLPSTRPGSLGSNNTLNQHSSSQPSETELALANAKLPQQETPVPKAKMKTINWNKIPNNKVVGKNNIWSLVAQSHQHSPMADLDWAEMEGLFCQQASAPTAPVPSSAPHLVTNSPRLGARDENRRDNSEITLLDGKKSLNVNIFLKQFRSSHEDIVKLVREVQPDDIGAERLRGLLRLLPELDELEMLLGFDGDRSRLGTAESFLLRLISVPNYKLRIESMLLKEEFAANMGFLEPSINAMIVAGEDLMTHRALQEVLYMVLVAGNFLNSGGYAGNAAGVKLTSLQKLTDIRANKPGMNLLHFVALQAQRRNEELIKFPDQLTALEDATKTSVEQLQNDINTLDVRIKKIHKQIDMPTTEKEIKDQMAEFLQIAEQEVSALKRDMNDLEDVKKELSEFFCEDLASFKLEECFRILHTFCTKFRQAVLDNARRALQEEQAAARRRQREEQLAGKRRQLLVGQTGGTFDSEASLTESLFGLTQKKSFDKDSKFIIQSRKFQNGNIQNSGQSEEEVSVTSSPAVSRRRTGSFSGPSGDLAPAPNTLGREENYSPDVTPNGTLRRRRSRVPSEEDDSSLMDFLRTTGQPSEVPKVERKSWGSLDRSWARRARGGGRKRPDLLTADFSGDRERPSSPSFPVTSQDRDPSRPPVLPSGLTPTEEGEGKPRAWRQKIEAWLLDSEKEEKMSEEQRRRRRPPTNRRSAETSVDSTEGDTRNGAGILDTLPEGKLAEQVQYKRVYSDWKPTIEKTDVVGAMEAIEEAQQPTTNPNIKDKSQWRKSNLNVATSKDEAEMNSKRLRRIRSRTQIEEPDGNKIGSQLDSTKDTQETEKSKAFLESLGKTSLDDKLTLYLQKPIPPVEPIKREQHRPTSLYLHPSLSSTQPSPLSNVRDPVPDYANQPSNEKDYTRNPRTDNLYGDPFDSPQLQRRELLFGSQPRLLNRDKNLNSPDSSGPKGYVPQSPVPTRRHRDENSVCRKVSEVLGEDKLSSFVRLGSLIKNDGGEDFEMGDGSKFDRFSPVRRTTRRHKKSDSPETSIQKVEPTVIQIKDSNEPLIQNKNSVISQENLESENDTISSSTTPRIGLRNKLESQMAFDENTLSKTQSSTSPFTSHAAEPVWQHKEEVANKSDYIRTPQSGNNLDNYPKSSNRINKPSIFGKEDIKKSDNANKTVTKLRRSSSERTPNLHVGLRSTLTSASPNSSYSAKTNKNVPASTVSKSATLGRTSTGNSSEAEKSRLIYRTHSLGRTPMRNKKQEQDLDEGFEESFSNTIVNNQARANNITPNSRTSRGLARTPSQSSVGVRGTPASQNTSLARKPRVSTSSTPSFLRTPSSSSVLPTKIPSRQQLERTNSRSSLRSSRSSVASNPSASSQRKSSFSGRQTDNLRDSTSTYTSADKKRSSTLQNSVPNFKVTSNHTGERKISSEQNEKILPSRFGFRQNLKLNQTLQDHLNSPLGLKRNNSLTSNKKNVRNDSISAKENLARTSSGSLSTVTKLSKTPSAKSSSPSSLSFMRPTAASTSKETNQEGSSATVPQSRIHRLAMKNLPVTQVKWT